MQMNSTVERDAMPHGCSSSGDPHRTILTRRMVNIARIRLSPSEGERTKVRGGSATIAAKSTQPSPYPLPWKGRGGKNCAAYLPKRDSNSR
jgi:hypothetical protein